MREIKFRAWHTIHKKMYPASELGADQMTLSVDGRGFVNVSGKSVELSQFAGNKMIPLQYTGLKDKNGKEIYEGDILNLGEVGYAKPELVIFARGSFGIKASWITNESEDPFFELNKYCNLVFRDCVEVIGNIYENPELLEVKE